MNRAGTVLEQLHPQVVRPRPQQFETPNSYLARLCTANLIEISYLRWLIRNRSSHTGRPDETAYVINELGGPKIGHFYSEYARATTQPAPRPKDVFSARHRTRTACLRCAGGEEIDTYDHRQFTICLKHNRWVGRKAADQRQIIEPRLHKVERRYRRLGATGLIPVDTHDAIATAIDRHPQALGEYLTLSPTRQLHPHIDRYPAQVRILETITNYLAEHWPLRTEVRNWHRRPEQARIYGYLRHELSWLDSPAHACRLIDDLAATVINTLINRTVGFS